MDQIVLTVEMHTEFLETENQPEPFGNSFLAPESEMKLPKDCVTSVLWKPECTPSSDSKVNRIGEDPEDESQLSLGEWDSKPNSSFIQESDDSVLMAKLGFFLDKSYEIKEEMQVAFCGAQQAQNVIAEQATEIRKLKTDLQLAEREIRKEIARKQLLEVEFEEFKKKAAVFQRQKEELEKEVVALKESEIKRKADWRTIELQITAENYGLKRAVDHLGTVNQRMSERNESLELSAIRSANELAAELLRKENQGVRNTRETFVQSAQKAEKEQVAALSEMAVEDSKGVVEAENAESDLQNPDKLKTDSKSTETKNPSWIKKWLTKRGLSQRKPEESELTKLLRSTRILMMNRAKDLKEQAKTVAIKGKRLTERAKQLLRK